MCKCIIYSKRPCFENEIFTLPDGQAVRLCWLKHVQPKGVVLLLHGILGVSSDFAVLAEALHLRGYTVVGLDRRGHGLPLTIPKCASCSCSFWSWKRVLPRL
jgi:alpha-beta hydrolase superfamily lysophospholipase